MRVISLDSEKSTSGCLDPRKGVQFFLKNLRSKYMQLFQLCNNCDGTSLFVVRIMAPSGHYEQADWQVQWGIF
jgi:hypothetical protein